MAKPKFPLNLKPPPPAPELDSVMTHTDLANAKMLLALAQTLQALGNDTRHETLCCRIRDVMDNVLETLEDEDEDDA